MNYPFSTPSPYIQSAMSHAVQAMMMGAALPQNCVIMAMPIQQAQQILPQLMMNSGIGGNDAMLFSQQSPYYGPPPYMNNPQPLALPPSYNYALVPYKNNNHRNRKSKKKSHPQQPHSNIYNSSSFDSYMDNLSWSRLFHHSSRKTSKQTNQKRTSIHFDKKSISSKQQRSNSPSSSSSSSSSSSTTSDETIRRVDVVQKQSSHNNSKQQTKGSLPFKYSSEFIPSAGKQQSQKIKSNDIFVVKKA